MCLLEAFSLVFEDLRVYQLMKNGRLEARKELRFPVGIGLRKSKEAQ